MVFRKHKNRPTMLKTPAWPFNEDLPSGTAGSDQSNHRFWPVEPQVPSHLTGCNLLWTMTQPRTRTVIWGFLGNSSQPGNVESLPGGRGLGEVDAGQPKNDAADIYIHLCICVFIYFFCNFLLTSLVLYLVLQSRV